MPATNQRRPKTRESDKTLKSELRKGRAKNTRLPKNERHLKRSLNVHKAEVSSLWIFQIGMVWRALATAIILPLTLVTFFAFVSCFSATIDASLWRTPPFWFFSLGMVVWGLIFFGVGRPIYLYVWGHEATHALFTWMCLGKVHEFKVTAEGGHIVTDKNNLLIALSPYFVPLYALAAAFVFWLLGSYFDLTKWHELPLPLIEGFRWSWLAYWILGLTWGFHLTFTVWMIVKDQPDLRNNGTVFSLNFIVLANLFLLTLLLIQASPGIYWDTFLTQWGVSAKKILSGMAGLLMGVHRLLGSA